jgi:nitrogen fixation NifU-like protein
MAYNVKVLDHYENPRNVGSLDKNSMNVGTGMVGAPSCGDVMKLQIEIEGGVIKDAKFKTFGCGSAIASSSLITEMIKGKDLDYALSIKNKDIANELGLPPVKHHCSVLAEDAIKAAVLNYKTKQEAANTNSKIATAKIIEEHQNNHGIEITKEALEKIQNILLNERDKTTIRFITKDGGCSGQKYDIALDSELHDHHINLGWKIQITEDKNTHVKHILIDAESIDLLKNTVIDYEKNDLNEKFVFKNPNATSTCGCGKSFS